MKKTRGLALLIGLYCFVIAGAAVADIWTPTARGGTLGATVTKDANYICKVKIYSSARESNSWKFAGNLDGEKTYSQYWSNYGSTDPQYYFVRVRSVLVGTDWKAYVHYSTSTATLYPSMIGCEEETLDVKWVALLMGLTGVVCASVFWWAVIRAAT